MSEVKSNHAELTADIVSAFVSKNSIPASELPALIHAVHGSLNTIGEPVVVPVIETKPPAVAIKKSVTDEAITCLECGMRFKSLKRHLYASYSMSPEEYRAKWHLLRDYPMVAPAYAEERSALAKKMRLGQRRGDAGPLTETGDVRAAS